MNLSLEQYESCGEWAVEFFNGHEEIGSSDINCCIVSWCSMHGVDKDGLADCQWSLLKRVIHSALWEAENE